jgi:DNA repair protein RecO (recombination protein O)
MQWVDNAIVLAVKKHGESSAILTLLTEESGLHYGMVKGISSPKWRGTYQQGNLISANWKARLPEHLGFISGELLYSSAALVMGDPLRLAALSSMCTVIAHCLPEREKEQRVFGALRQFIALLASEDQWQHAYIKLEILLLSALGFGLELSECAATGSRDNLCYVSPNTGKAVCEAAGAPYRDKLFTLPNFLKNATTAYTQQDVMLGLRLTGYFLEKWNFRPRNMTLPQARCRLEELLAR